MSSFDVNTTMSSEFGIFGIPCSPDKAQIHILPVPWEVTTSYGSGASQGPQLIRRASEQVDFLDLEIGKTYEVGIYMQNEPKAIVDLNNTLKPLAQELIQLKTMNSSDQARIKELLQKVNQGCNLMTQWVYEQTREILKVGKWPVLLGGDHSTPLGAIKAITEHYKGKVGILHVDAHADLRKAYQGFQQSHASIMNNVLHLNPQPLKLVQVGIRDFCEEEYDLILGMPGKVKTFFDLDLKRDLFEGQTWNGICQQITSELPESVYVSFDIDGLDPSLCPNTGTPVPGGLSLNEAYYLLYSLHKAGKKIVGFDINEVSAAGDLKNEWNGNVGARLLYKMCGWLAKTQRLL
jgi:agmatinase